MNKCTAVPLAIVSALSPESALALQDSVNPFPLWQLSDGGTLRHDKDRGILLRLDQTGRQISQVKVPKAPIRSIGALTTEIVVSKDETRLLVVHSADTLKWRPPHRVMILDTTSLRTVTDFPLGDCSFYQFPPGPRPEHVTLLCHDSPDPSDKKGKKTLALVTLDLIHSQITRWFALGGERRGTWVGPMFFGYRDDASAFRATVGCTTIEPADARPRILQTVDASEHPEHVIVVRRKGGPTKGDVWFVGPGVATAPRRVATLSSVPKTATLCGDVLQVIGEVDDAAGKWGHTHSILGVAEWCHDRPGRSAHRPM
jgi:hypothetical protein